MKTLYLCPVVISLLFAACAGVDSAVMDTAETLGKGKISVSNNFTMGLNLPEWVNMNSEDIYESDTVHPLGYPELKLGLAPDLDISVRFGIVDEAKSAKLLVKKQMSKDEKVSTAIVVGGGALFGSPNYWDVDEYGNYDSFEVYSGDLAFLLTRKLMRAHYATLAFRGSYHRFGTKFTNDTWEYEDVYNAGVRLNGKLVVDPFFGILELGVEAPLSIEDTKQVYPWMGIGAGIEFDL